MKTERKILLFPNFQAENDQHLPQNHLRNSPKQAAKMQQQLAASIAQREQHRTPPHPPKPHEPY